MKIFKLFIDENIKTWKKLSTKIMIIAIILSLFAVLTLVKFMEKTEENHLVYNSDNSTGENEKEFLEREIEFYESQLKNEKLDEETRLVTERNLEMYKLYLEYDISPYNNTWENELVDYIVEQKINGQNTDETLALLKNKNYNNYIEYQKKLLKQQLDNNTISEQEYNDGLTILDLKEKYEIGKNNDQESYWKRNIIQKIENAQNSLRTGINKETNKLINAEEKKDLEDSIKLNMYRLENNIPDSNNGSNTNYRMRFELLAPMFSIAVISIAIIVIAGGTISNEISTGTIKFWALTPNKRWKIMTAKLLSILFYIIILVLITSLLSVFIANVFFAEDGETYLYCQNGEVKEIGNTLYTIEYYFVKAIPIVIFALFAVMLSTITRNTAVAVSFSVALYIGNGIAMQIINQFITKDWVKFIPFNNLNLTTKIFPNATDMTSMMFGTNFATSTSLIFSLAVLGVCAFLMLVTMYDSFNKRDII